MANTVSCNANHSQLLFFVIIAIIVGSGLKSR